MVINHEVIRQAILADWQSHEVSLDITLTRLRLHDNVPKKDVVKAEVTTHTGWEGMQWEDMPKELNSMLEVNNRTRSSHSIDF